MSDATGNMSDITSSTTALIEEPIKCQNVESSSPETGGNCGLPGKRAAPLPGSIACY